MTALVTGVTREAGNVYSAVKHRPIPDDNILRVKS